MRILLYITLLFSFTFSNDLNNLLKEYESESNNSLTTVDEKLGHVMIYSQKELKLMQYNTLSDILEELALNNTNKSRLGVPTLSLPGTKTAVNGFFRLFINDHEISSTYTQNAELNWGDLPLDFVDHIEVYHGDSSFTLGNETGIFFIRIYTKNPKKENGGKIHLRNTSKNSQYQNITYADSFNNGWSFLTFLNNSKTKDKRELNQTNIKNDEDRRYFFLALNNEDTNIDFAYTDLKKDPYVGLAFDLTPDKGNIEGSSYYLDFKKYFLRDGSLKTNLSIDVENTIYEETNESGIALVPVLNLASLGTTIPKEFKEEMKFINTNAYLGKTTKVGNSTLLTALSIKNKKYELKNRTTTNFANIETKHGHYHNFDEETIYSALFENSYRFNKDLVFIANAKFDKYNRNGIQENFTENLFRIGSIYTPFKRIGIKGFYTETYVPPSFYNIDYADRNNPNLKNQIYKYYSLEFVYALENSKFNIIYNNTKIDDFIYYTPVGFRNIDHKIKQRGVTANYKYEFQNENELHINFFYTGLSEQINNSTDGGYIKYMGKSSKIEYFTSLIYRNGYEYLGEKVENSYDLNIGLSYNITPDLTFSIKGENLLDKSTKSLYSKGISQNVSALENEQRKVNFSIKWAF